jgi:hypothetical protein
MAAPGKRAIANASPLICLDKINKLELLGDIYEQIMITTEVMKEIADGKNGPALVKKIKALPWAKIVETTEAPRDLVEWDLGKGETSIIAWAGQYPGILLIIDDRAASRCAKIYGLEVIGTIGVLLRAKELGMVTEIKSSIDALVQSGFWISDHFRKSILERAGE